MRFRAAPLVPDRVTLKVKSVPKEREGELDLPIMVNMLLDEPKRTLLALRGLQIIPRLMLSALWVYM